MLRVLRLANFWALKRLRPGLRSIVGMLFVIGGFFGFLPILGFWMIPVGLYLIAMEFPKYRRLLRDWILTQKKKIMHADPAQRNG